VITTKKSSGQVESYPFEASYFVVKPLAVVSATKMNVVYRGIPNPISISVPGYSAQEIMARTSIGSLSAAGQAGTYNLSVPVNDVNKELVVEVSVKDKATNSVRKMGEQRYRLKNIPKPTPRLGAIDASGEYSSGVLQASPFVYAELKDFAFEGINYTPIEYAILWAPKKGDARVLPGKGQAVTPEMKNAFKSSRPGDRFVLAEMKAQGPAGLVRVPLSLTITIK
jgi:gliding motility-associated protein GldM